MSVIEDSREPMQDFLAPELRGTSVPVDALKKKVTEVDTRAEKRHVVALAKIYDLDRRTEKRFNQLDARSNQLLIAVGSLADYNALRNRISS